MKNIGKILAFSIALSTINHLSASILEDAVKGVKEALGKISENDRLAALPGLIAEAAFNVTPEKTVNTAEGILQGLSNLGALKTLAPDILKTLTQDTINAASQPFNRLDSMVRKLDSWQSRSHY